MSTIIPAHPGFWLLIWPPDPLEGFANDEEKNNALPDRFAIIAWDIETNADTVPITVRCYETENNYDEDRHEAILAPDGTVVDRILNGRSFPTIDLWIIAMIRLDKTKE
jgi:hypothetical protein